MRRETGTRRILLTVSVADADHLVLLEEQTALLHGVGDDDPLRICDFCKAS